MAEIVKVCPICGKEFIAKRKERIFCSKNCQYKSRSIDITRSEEHTSELQSRE